MARINLLPWRENLRKQRRKEFGISVLMALVATLLLLGYSHLHIVNMIEAQNDRNNFLKKEIAAVERKIREIKDLERTKAQLLARMNVIQQLQTSRPQIVHLFDELASTLPDGVFLTQFVQQGKGLTMDGRAQSNARVSSYMRNVDAANWIGNPILRVIENKDKTTTGLSHFQMAAVQMGKAKRQEGK